MTPPRTRDFPQRCVAAGYLAGVITGGGAAGVGWMNPYIALSLLLGGVVLCVVANVAAKR